MKIGVCLLLLVVSMPIAAKPPFHRDIPAAFRGHWEMHAENCGTGFANQSMEISTRHIQMFEVRASVSRVELLSPDAVRVESRVRDGLGNFWGDESFLTLSENGIVLRSGNDANSQIYYHCRQTKANRR